MTWLVAWLCFFVVLAMSGLLSGTETGLYSLSRVRVDAEAERGSRALRTVKKLLQDDSALLVTLLLLNNAANQALAFLGPVLMAPLSVPEQFTELVATLLFTPVILFFAELFPKDLFRRRPHHLVPLVAVPIYWLKLLLMPLTVPLGLLISAVTRILGLDASELGRAQGREVVFELLRERNNAAHSPTESLARNALELRSLRVERVMVPWRKVLALDLSRPAEEVLQGIRSSTFTRLPALDRLGHLCGYLHQLEVLAGLPGKAPNEALRPLPYLEPGTPLDRALERLRLSGQRLAVVGTATRPLGLVTLKDLLEEISGELHRW